MRNVFCEWKDLPGGIELEYYPGELPLEGLHRIVNECYAEISDLAGRKEFPAGMNYQKLMLYLPHAWVVNGGLYPREYKRFNLSALGNFFSQLYVIINDQIVNHTNVTKMLDETLLPSGALTLANTEGDILGRQFAKLIGARAVSDLMTSDDFCYASLENMLDWVDRFYFQDAESIDLTATAKEHILEDLYSAFDSTLHEMALKKSGIRLRYVRTDEMASF